MRFKIKRVMVLAVSVAAILAFVRYMFIDNWPDQVLYSAMSAISGDRTIYSKGYSESRFRSLRVGMTARQVEAVMGVPLKRVLWADYGQGKRVEGDVWSYTRSNKVLGDYKVREVWFQDGIVFKLVNDYRFD